MPSSLKYLLLTLLSTLLFSLSLWAIINASSNNISHSPLASLIGGQQSTVGGQGQALPPDRAEMYKALLQKTIRQQPYLIAPDEDAVLATLRTKLGPNATEATLQAAIDAYYAQFHQQNNKHSGPNPLAYLGRLKAKEIAQTKKQTEYLTGTIALTGTPQILSIMVNFTGTYTFQTGETGDAVMHQGVCLTDTTVYSPATSLTMQGPSFNQIPSPVDSGDNRLAWLDPNSSYTGGFSQQYYQEFMFGTQGYTASFRPDLENPYDGGMGFDFSGVTFRNYYAEQSRGNYIPHGSVIEINIPQAQAFYGADACDGSQYFGPVHRLAIAAADQINQQYLDFNWATWDQEDVFDYDNDGNFFEADGYVDHFFIIYAGLGNHFGPNSLEMQIWGHSSDVNADGIGSEGPANNQLGGYQVYTDTNHPLGGIWILNYTASDEGAGLGILAHEYGHDIGLPDNYGLDSSSPNPGLWDLMASGNWSGELAGMRPVGLSIWDKIFLGWNTPLILDTTASTNTYTIGQQSIATANSLDGLQINLPDIAILPPINPSSGNNLWWSEQGHNRNESISQLITPQIGDDLIVSAQLAYDIEDSWDYHFWEYSIDHGITWVALPVFDANGEKITVTAPTDNKPNNKPAITGLGQTTWLTASATISATKHNGNFVIFRFRYFQDNAVEGMGVYLDDIKIEGSVSGVFLFDDTESGDSWTHSSEGANNNSPWLITDGRINTSHYYLVEWRNAGEKTGANGTGNTSAAFTTAGFDLGLNRSYWLEERLGPGQSIQNPMHIHTPGMLVWYVNNLYNNNAFAESWFEQNPAYGPKGRLLLVDANPDNYLISDPDPSVGKNIIINPFENKGVRELGKRRSAFDGAFSLQDRPAFSLKSDINGITSTVNSTVIPSKTSKPIFRDRIGAFSGADSFFTGASFNAGVVLPTVNNVPYHSAWQAAYTAYPRSGNPGVNAFGVNLQVIDQAENGTWGMVKFWMDNDTIFVDKHATIPPATLLLPGNIITYTIRLKDAAGNRWHDRSPYKFVASFVDALPANALYIEDSLNLQGQGDVNYIDGKFIWRGLLGGGRLDEPDAIIQYAVVYTGSGTLPLGSLQTEQGWCLNVSQKQIMDDFQAPNLLWPKHSIYGPNAALCIENPALTITKTINHSPNNTNLATSGFVTYTIILTNQGEGIANDVTIIDVLPQNISFDKFVENSFGASEANNTITWTGTISANNSLSLQFRAIYDVGTFIGDLTITNTVQFNSPTASSGSASVAFNLFNEYEVYLPLVFK